MNMFNNNNDDNESTSGRIRRMLEQCQEDKEKLYKNPIYKEGFQDGEASGRNDANLRARMVIRGLFEIFEEEGPPVP